MGRLKEKIKWDRLKRINWIILAVSLLVILAVSSLSTRYFELGDFQPGDASPRTFRADQNYRLIDRSQTREKLEQKLSQLRPSFIRSYPRENTIDSAVRNRLLSELGGEDGLPVDEKERLEKITSQMLTYLFDRGVIKNKNIFAEFKLQEEAVIHKVGPPADKSGDNREVVELATFRQRLIGMDELETKLDNIFQNVFENIEAKGEISRLFRKEFKPTIVFEDEEFQKAKKEVREGLTPEYITVSEGDIILGAGEQVTEKKYNLLRQINRSRLRFQILHGLLRAAIIVLGAIFIYLYLDEFEPDFFEKPNKLALVCLLVVVINILAVFIHYLEGQLLVEFEFMLPFAAIPALLTIMLSAPIAVLFSIFLSLLVVSFFSFTFELFVMFLLGGLTAIFSVRDVERRTELIRSGLYVGGVQVFVVLLFLILQPADLLSARHGTVLLWAGLNGAVLTPFVVIGGLPFLENGFKITTNFKLQELADLNHPLLRKLFEQAPGSYQHSIILSNLCEQAASAIGANTLLARAGTYFHDIGKAEVPEYFAENQGSDNPHDELKPTLSASILKSHVKKGVEIAEEADLPEEIIGMIKQHHGTTRMQYFYHRALEESDEEVTEDEFRYPGPIPQFKEAALLMLGDSAEAASRSLEEPTHQKIESVVRGVIYDKFKQGQLNECELTLKDLDVIARIFTRVLSSVHHKRVSYPDEDETEELEEAREDEDNSN
ncbi:MAG: HD family phosphohydrolase [bacterium]